MLALRLRGRAEEGGTCEGAHPVTSHSRRSRLPVRILWLRPADERKYLMGYPLQRRRELALVQDQPQSLQVLFGIVAIVRRGDLRDHGVVHLRPDEVQE